MKYSIRAKKGRTVGVLAKWKFLQTDLEEEKRTLKKIQVYKKFKLPGFKTMETRHKNGVKTTQNQIKTMRARILMLQRQGKITKIL